MSIDPNEIDSTPEQRQQLAELVEAAGRPWPEVMCEALQNYHPSISGPRIGDSGDGTFYDAMKDLIRTVRGAPPDLSTNRK